MNVHVHMHTYIHTTKCNFKHSYNMLLDTGMFMFSHILFMYMFLRTCACMPKIQTHHR